MRWSLFAVLLLGALHLPAEGAPRFVYLSWQSDPMTSVTVSFHTISTAPDASSDPGTSVVYYDTIAHNGDVESYAFRATGTLDKIAEVPGRRVHHVILAGLQSDRAYWFIAGNDTRSMSAERAFRTAPAGDAPLRFVAAGDMGVADKSKRLQRMAAAQEPLFVLLGGDLAYANGDWSQWPIWDQWLDNWQEAMVTPEGFTVPMVSAIGNHEVAVGYGGTPQDAPVYLRYFAQNGEGTYYSRRVGSRLVIFVLDSGHLAAHGGDQAIWLDQQLTAHANVPVRLATYHVPLFPGFRQPSGRYSKAGRKHWQPLFDRHELMVAFENHDHVFKRTHAIRGKRVDPQGTIYLGDGAFGRGPRVVDGPRQTHLRRRWYLDRLLSKGHVWRVDVTADSAVFAAVDHQGHVFDRVAKPIP